MEISVEVIAAAAGAAATVAGGVVAWLNLFLDSKLSKFREQLFQQMNGRYISKEIADERYHRLKEQVDKIEQR